MNKNKKSDLKFIIVFVVVVSLSLLYLFQASYAKYKKQIEGDVRSTIASWNIKVNNETINNKSLLSSYITPTIYPNQYVKSGVLAPGSQGYFDIVINASEVDVDFTYQITGALNVDTNLVDLKLTAYEVGGVRTNYDNNTVITGEIAKNTGNTTVRVYFEWDDVTGTMNNASDTEYASNSANQNPKIRVSILFEQKRQT